ncbi:beta-lactamase family protein [bacterium]|nr:beta-lactamase family protein [bacterium]NUN45453.1 serine hydrolase [bacterium]
MSKIFKLSALYLFLILCACNSNNSKKNESNKQAQTADLILKLHQIITPFVDKGFVGVVLFADSSDIIMNRAYGKSKNNHDSNTTFWIASNTKPITAIAILKLQEDGKLSVKDSITKFLKNVPSDKKNITIEQLLTHLSGLPSDFIAEGEQNMELAVKQILSQKLISEPGKEFNYTNDGYILLAAIIELSSNKKYESYIRDAVFTKSGMTNSGFWGGDDIAVDPVNDSAKYYPFYPKIFRDGKTLENWNNKGAAGISSNTADLYKMMIALNSGQLLNQISLRELFRPRFELSNTNDTILSFAYGWAIVQSKENVLEIRHRGRGDWMHNNSIYFLKNGYKIIVWAKDTGPNNNAWSTEICKSLIQELNLLEKANR